jgi:hypothetical protein
MVLSSPHFSNASFRPYSRDRKEDLLWAIISQYNPIPEIGDYEGESVLEYWEWLYARSGNDLLLTSGKGGEHAMRTRRPCWIQYMEETETGGPG